MALDRRGFFKAVSATGLLAAGEVANETAAHAAPLTEKEKLDRIASNTWPIRHIFKGWPNVRPNKDGSQSVALVNNPLAESMKKKYGQITMLDFPQFTKDHFSGVTHMDLFSGLFGDNPDDSQFVEQTGIFDGKPRASREFDPSSSAGRKWLDKMAAKNGRHRHHLPAHFQQRPARPLRT